MYIAGSFSCDESLRSTRFNSKYENNLVYFRQKKYNKYLAVLCVDYITTKEAARNWGITDRRIKGAKRRETHGLFLLTPKNRPTDDEKDGEIK